MTQPNPKAQPVSTQWVRLGDNAAHEGYLALPPAGSGPGLLLVQEIFGVNAHIRAVAEQYALAGFVVLAPDVFWRQAPKVELGYEGEDMKRGFALAMAMKPDEVVADLRGAVAALKARPEVGGGKVAALGYCMGGRLAYTAAALAGVQAAVAYYGGGIQTQLGMAAQVSCPMLFHYAEHDEHIPPAAVEQVRQAMAGKPAQVLVYPGTHHGFNCWARASYQPRAAALAFGRSVAFLAEHLF
jgi:carboxymethylenebutenolidase